MSTDSAPRWIIPEHGILKFALDDDRSRRGIALIITLAFVVLLTFAVVAFFSRATYNRGNESKSTGRVKAEIVARSAVDAIVADLISEMKAHSSTANVNGTLVLTPTNNTYMVPERNDASNPIGSGTNYTLKVTGSDARFLNLVKQSISGQRLFTSANGAIATTIGSPINSGSAALDGRTISSSRWNKPVLTSLNAFTSGSQTPDWVLFSRAGILQDPNPSIDTVKDSRATSTVNSQYVIGRFAVNIYDEGGLIDVNVAGYNAATSGTALALIQSTLAGKQLGGQFPNTKTPGITIAGAGQFVDWRTATALKATAFTGGKPTSSPYVNYILTSASSGFLTLFRDPPATGINSDKKLFSRQDLINYVTAGQDGKSGSPPGFVPGTSGSSTLPFLTTFSRDLDRPSYIPNPNRPKIPAAGTGFVDPAVVGQDVSDTTGINPSFVKLIDSSGQPVVKKRFPLDRLAWLTPTGPNAATSTVMVSGSSVAIIPAIQACFGLTWDSGNSRWSYRNNATTILRLNDAMIVGKRDPDFFELLKASICAGSLGKAAYKPNSGGTANEVDATRHISLNAQVMQIGANIIDQYDDDSFPTAIQFNNTMFYGVEDIPYFSGARIRPVCTNVVKPIPNMSGTNTTHMGKMFVVPLIHNPHAPPAVAPSPAKTPLNFRIWAEKIQGIAPTTVIVDYDKIGPGAESGIPSKHPTLLDAQSRLKNPAPSAGFGFDQPNTASNVTAALLFSTNPAASDWATRYRMPVALSEATSAYPAPYNDYKFGSTETTNNQSVEYTPPGYSAPRTLIGFNVADFPWKNSYVSGTGRAISYACYATESSGRMKIHLQYQSNSKWLEYDSQNVDMKHLINLPTDSITDVTQHPTWSDQLRICSLLWEQTTFPFYAKWFKDSNNGALYLWLRAGSRFRSDPRTNRFGTAANNTTESGIGTTGFLPNIFTTIRPGTTTGGGLLADQITDAGFVGQAGSNHTSPGTFSENNSALKYEDGGLIPKYYKDPDGVVRPAIGRYAPVTSGITSGMAGLPLASGKTGNNTESRPVMLNRPFWSVAELGYTFRDTPWRNLDFSNPESGDTALLDVFSIHETNSLDSLVAGRVNLNTRHSSVLVALLNGTYVDSGAVTPLAAAYQNAIAAAQVARTTGKSADKGPVQNRAELVGRLISSGSYGGLSEDLTGILGSLAVPGTTVNAKASNLTRMREVAERGLADIGTTRSWNLMIDVIAQSGRYPPTASTLSQFVVEGETHYWVHVAIDRFTGKVIDQQIEVVKE